MATLSVTLLGIGGIFILVVLSAFFSSSESAIFSLPADWESGSHVPDNGRVRQLRELRRDPHRLLVTILVGNNLVNMAIASITTVLLIDVLPAGSAVSLATVLGSFVVLVFGEIVPKSYGIGHARQWALRVAGPITVVETLISPLVLIFDLLTRRLNAVIDGDTDIEKPYLDE